MILDKHIPEPAAELLTTAAAKAWLKIDHSDDDDVIADLVASARKMIEDWCGITLGARTGVTVYAQLTEDFSLPYGPQNSGDFAAELHNGVEYVPKTDGDDYRLKGEKFQTFCPYTCGEWKLTYDAGYTAIPTGLKTIWLNLIAFLYENRGEEGAEMPKLIQYALNPYRRSLI